MKIVEFNDSYTYYRNKHHENLTEKEENVLPNIRVIPRMSNPKMSNPRMSNPKMSNAKMSNRVLTLLVQF